MPPGRGLALIGEQGRGLLAPAVAIFAQIGVDLLFPRQHGPQHGDFRPRIRPVAMGLRIVALGWLRDSYSRKHPVQFGGVDEIGSGIVLAGRNAAFCDGPLDRGLVLASRFCGLTEGVTHGSRVVAFEGLRNCIWFAFHSPQRQSASTTGNLALLYCS